MISWRSSGVWLPPLDLLMMHQSQILLPIGSLLRQTTVKAFGEHSVWTRRAAWTPLRTRRQKRRK